MMLLLALGLICAYRDGRICCLSAWDLKVTDDPSSSMQKAAGLRFCQCFSPRTIQRQDSAKIMWAGEAMEFRQGAVCFNRQKWLGTNDVNCAWTLNHSLWLSILLFLMMRHFGLAKHHMRVCDYNNLMFQPHDDPEARFGQDYARTRNYGIQARHCVLQPPKVAWHKWCSLRLDPESFPVTEHIAVPDNETPQTNPTYLEWLRLQLINFSGTGWSRLQAGVLKNCLWGYTAVIFHGGQSRFWPRVAGMQNNRIECLCNNVEVLYRGRGIYWIKGSVPV